MAIGDQDVDDRRDQDGPVPSDRCVQRATEEHFLGRTVDERQHRDQREIALLGVLQHVVDDIAQRADHAHDESAEDEHGSGHDPHRQRRHDRSAQAAAELDRAQMQRTGQESAQQPDDRDRERERVERRVARFGRERQARAAPRRRRASRRRRRAGGGTRCRAGCDRAAPCRSAQARPAVRPRAFTKRRPVARARAGRRRRSPWSGRGRSTGSSGRARSPRWSSSPPDCAP